jgi:VWFA-related protein
MERISMADLSMRRLFPLMLVVVLCLAPLPAQESDDDEKVDPLDVNQTEEVRVRLILVDVVVLDRQDRTISNLTKDDFEIIVDGNRTPIDTLDTVCPGGGAEDVVGVRDPRKRAPVPAPGADRKIVIALDYLHLPHMQRTEVLDEARRMMEASDVPGEQIMVVALNGGLRIEQGFTADRGQVRKTLKRMQYDITLWEPSFRHLTDEPFFTGLQGLFAVLESVPGPKAVVLFSSHPGRTAATEDLRFAELAASASASRSAIYPVHGTGLVAGRPG